MVITKEVKSLYPYFVFLVFSVFPFGQLFRFELYPGVALQLLDFSVGAVVFLWVVQGAREQKITIDYHVRLLLSFLGIALFTFFLGAIRLQAKNVLEGGLYLLRFAVYIGFLISLFQMVKNAENFKLITLGMWTAGLLTLLFGICQYIFFPDLRALAILGWDEHYYRLAGTFLDPGFTGIILVLFLFYVLRNESASRVFKFLLSMVIVISIALTFSRATYLSLVVGLLVFSYIEKRVVVPFLLLAAFVLSVALVPKPSGEGVSLGRSSTVEARLANYEGAEKLIAQYPLFGAGFNFLGSYQLGGLHSKGGVDSSLLFVAATTGVIGLVTFLFWYFKLGLLALSTRSSLLFSSLAAVFVHSLFQNSLFYSWVLVWLFSLIVVFRVSRKP